MKFGQDFQAALDREEFPKEWVDSAISYKKLKKCIKRVQKEMLSLGLDQETMNQLWQHVSRGSEIKEGESEGPPMLHYTVDGDQKVAFTPKLTIALDPRDGSPMDAWLSPETRSQLKRLSRNLKSREASISPDRNELGKPEMQSLHHVAMADDVDDSSEGSADQQEPVETVEVPLTSDSEFFQILTQELKSLENLQEKEQKELQSDITELGNDLRNLKISKKKRSKDEIEAWRKVFELYNDAEVFVSSHEQDAGARNVEHAQRQFDWFLKTLSEQQQQHRLVLGNDAKDALDKFIRINVNLLKLMKFQNMNQTALTKIMKKFDKQTALHARAAIPEALAQGSAMTEELAKATSFTISNELLHIIPQLNDYLCPICFSITYKPVRLSCTHVYCIRCLIVMQKEKQNECPLCRAPVVLTADSDNVDKYLKHFLENNFKAEVKEKQKENELAVAIDRFGETYGKGPKCAIM